MCSEWAISPECTAWHSDAQGMTLLMWTLVYSRPQAAVLPQPSPRTHLRALAHLYPWGCLLEPSQHGHHISQPVYHLAREWASDTLTHSLLLSISLRSPVPQRVVSSYLSLWTSSDQGNPALNFTIQGLRPFPSLQCDRSLSWGSRLLPSLSFLEHPLLYLGHLLEFPLYLCLSCFNNSFY